MQRVRMRRVSRAFSPMARLNSSRSGGGGERLKVLQGSDEEVGSVESHPGFVEKRVEGGEEEALHLGLDEGDVIISPGAHKTYCRRRVIRPDKGEVKKVRYRRK